MTASANLDIQQERRGRVRTAPLGGLFGAGRSGTTWLGAIVDSHPDVAYRFEPFHRLSKHPSVRRARQLIESDPLSDAQLGEVYEALRPANPLTSKPPFFTKHGVAAGRSCLWPIGRRVGRFGRLYERLYTSQPGTFIVFKEVSCEPLMARLLECTSVPAVYLVRHPCGLVASMLDGQHRGLMPTGRLGVLESLLAKHDSALAERYAGRMDALSEAEKNALLWRIDVERGVEAARRSPRALVVVYEELCTHPLEQASHVLHHFGFDVPEQTRRFIEQSTTADRGHRRRYAESFIGGYFSVFRDPKQSMNKWKQTLSADQQRQVRAAVEDSPAFAYCAAAGHWD